MGEKSYRFNVSMTNNNTGEVLGTSCCPVTMFCNGDGEKILDRWVKSLIRGLYTQNDGLTLELDFTPIVPLKQPLLF